MSSASYEPLHSNLLPLKHEDHAFSERHYFFSLFPFTRGWPEASSAGRFWPGTSFAGGFWEIHCLSPRVGRNREAQDPPHTFCIAMLDRATLSSNNSYYLIESIDELVINLPNISKVFVWFEYTLGTIIYKIKTS